MKFTKAEEIEIAQEDLGLAVGAYLRSKGWTPDCSLPGSMWLWTREISGRAVMVDRDTALGIELVLEDREDANRRATEEKSDG